MKSHVEKMKEKYPKRSEKSIRSKFYSKNLLRDDLEKELMNLLKNSGNQYTNRLILWDGTCRLCQIRLGKICSCKDREPCRYPEEIRYSMEAVGIDVSQTIENADLKIEWPPVNQVSRFGLLCFR